MKEFTSKLSAVLLTLAVIGGVGGYMTMSLAAPQPKLTTVATLAQPSTSAIETVTVIGHRSAD
jgi:hypothetical protein